MSDTPPDESGMKVFKEDVEEALRTVHDPEIPINIYDLGLIYGIKATAEGKVKIVMTLTTPNCPEAEAIPARVQEAVREHVPGVKSVEVELVWEPRWTKERMSEDAQLALGMF